MFENDITFHPSEGITQSMLASWMSCRQKSAYELALWEPQSQSVALVFGSLVHDILEHVYKRCAYHEEPNYNLPTTILAERLEVFDRTTARDLANPQDAIDTAIKVEALMREYLKFYVKDFEKKWLDVESRFDVDFQGWRLRGMMDGILQIARQHWLFETKTASRIEEDTLNTYLAMDFQNLFYLTCAEVATGKKLRGVIYNVIRKPQLRLKKTENRESFLERIEDDIKEKPKHYFKRFELFYPDDVREEFKEQLLAKLAEYSAWLAGDLATWRNETACRAKWNCTFLEACAAGGEMTGFDRSRVMYRELLPPKE